MPPRYYLFLFFVIGYGSSFAQNEAEPGCDIIRAAAVSWCQGDTAATIGHLEAFDHQYPECGLSVITCLKLGELYMALHRFGDAQAILKKGLATPFKAFCQPVGNDSCKRAFSGLYSPNAKGEMCILLSELAQRSFDTSIALHYLILADTQYIRHDCGNAVEDFRAKLSPRLADIYLSRGDTAKAIQRLLAFVLIDIEVAKKLKPLLRAKYSRAQVNRELDRGIAHIKKMREIKDGEKSDYLVFTAFGYEVLRSPYDHRKQLKNYLNRSLRLRWLRG